jgi:hypothetical protein
VKDPPRPVPELYDLDQDISETNNLADKYPDVVKELTELAKAAPNEPGKGESLSP